MGLRCKSDTISVKLNFNLNNLFYEFEERIENIGLDPQWDNQSPKNLWVKEAYDRGLEYSTKMGLSETQSDLHAFECCQQVAYLFEGVPPHVGETDRLAPVYDW